MYELYFLSLFFEFIYFAFVFRLKSRFPQKTINTVLILNIYTLEKFYSHFTFIKIITQSI